MRIPRDPRAPRPRFPLAMANLPGVVVAAALAGSCAAGSPQPDPYPTVLFVGGTVHTGEANRAPMEALAIRASRIVAVGPADQILPLRGPRTEVLDLRGATILPGLVDAHGHLDSLGHSLETIPLKDAASWEEVVRRVLLRAQDVPEGTWILGRGWDQNLWPHAVFPRHDLLSRAVPRHPVWLVRTDGHAAIANAEALRLAKITRDHEDPPGGRLVRDAVTGELTGVLVDHAMALVEGAIPEPTPEDHHRWLLRAQEHALAAGLTGVHDAGESPVVLDVLRRMDEAGELRLRVYAMARGGGPDDPRAWPPSPQLPGPGGRLTVRAVKFVADGALGSRGAALLAAYADDPGNLGLLALSREDMTERFAEAMRRGLQVAVHAIGDRANREALAALERAEALVQLPDPRPRIEHAQILQPEDFARFGPLGAIASVQPIHCPSDMPWAGNRLGDRRLPGAYAWRSLLEGGARLCGGSDFPVEPLNPLLGIHAAVTRRDAEGRTAPPTGWNPRERLTMEEALALFTSGAAYASFEEGRLGTLAPGKIADFVVLDRDPFRVPASAIPSIQVLETWIEGRREFARGEGIPRATGVEAPPSTRGTRRTAPPPPERESSKPRDWGPE